jgi:hypothetical protein
VQFKFSIEKCCKISLDFVTSVLQRGAHERERFRYDIADLVDEPFDHVTSILNERWLHEWSENNNNDKYIFAFRKRSRLKWLSVPT